MLVFRSSLGMALAWWDTGYTIELGRLEGAVMETACRPQRWPKFLFAIGSVLLADSARRDDTELASKLLADLHHPRRASCWLSFVTAAMAEFTNVEFSKSSFFVRQCWRGFGKVTHKQPMT